MSNANYDSSLLTKYLRDRNLFAWNFYNSDLVQQGRSVRPEQHPPVSGQVTLNRVLGGVVDYRNGVEVVPFEPEPVEEGGSTPAPPPPPPPASGGAVEWVTSISGVGNILVQSTIVDSTGNIYIAGTYGGSTAASVNSQNGVSSQVINVTAAGNLPRNNFWSQEAFIAKYNPVGVAQWIAKIDGDFSDGGFAKISLTTDTADNLYMTCAVSHNGSGVILYNGGSGAIGSAYGTVQSAILPDNNYNTILAKYLGSTGAIQWATTIYATATYSCTSSCISIDSDNFIYIGGNFTGNQNAPFDKIITINNVTTPNVSAGDVQVSAYGTLIQGNSNKNGFIVKYNSNGIAQAATRLTTTSDTLNINSIYAYYNTSIYVAGNYKTDLSCNNYSTTIPGSPPTVNVSSYGVMSGNLDEDIFLIKYNTSLATQWVTRLGSTGIDSYPSITVDSTENVIIAGQYQAATLTVYNSATSSGGTITPAASAFTLPNSGQAAVLLVKYNSDGVAQWATRIDGTSNENSAVATIGSSDSIYISCSYATGPVSIYNSDTTNTELVKGTGFANLCLVKYGSDGIASWATSVGANSAANCFLNGGIAYYSGYIYVGAAQSAFTSVPRDPIGFNSYTSTSAGSPPAFGVSLYGTLANDSDGGPNNANSFLAKYSA